MAETYKSKFTGQQIDDILTKAQEGSTGGTKLYRHCIRENVSADKLNRPRFSFSFVSTYAQPYTNSNFPSGIFSCCGCTVNNEIIISCEFIDGGTWRYNVCNLADFSQDKTLESTVDTEIYDTVTPL